MHTYYMGLLMIRLEKIQNNFHSVKFKNIKVWFSYETPIAIDNGALHVRENIWGPTTGKHLNHVSFDKDTRINSQEFDKLLEDISII